MIILTVICKPKKSPMLKKDQYAISCKTDEQIEFDEVIELAADKRGVAPTQIEAAAKDLFATLLELLKKGKSFKTPWMTGGFTMKGYLKEGEEINPKRSSNHSLNPYFKITPLVIEEILRGNIPISKQRIIRLKPQVDMIFDFYTKSNDTIVRGQAAVIKGKNFFIEDVDDIRIMLGDRHTECLYEANTFEVATKDEIHLILPESVPVGDYILRVIYCKQDLILADTYHEMVHVI